MQLLINTGYGETNMNASAKAIYSALYPEGQIDYSASFSLESSEGMSLVATCTSEVHLLPNEEDEFLLTLANVESHKECSEQFTRSQIAEYLNRFLAGDHTWANQFEWNKV